MSRPLWRHVVALLAICAATAIVYARVTRAYFCSYDDFIETHRAAFEDTQQPSKIFTTSHFGSPKYRPVNRLAILLSYRASDGNPIFFRIRNLSFHLLNAVLVYALGWLLFKNAAVSAAGAALFALHPLANQPVVAAVWTNTMAHTGFLLALVVFITAARAARWGFRLFVALLSAWLALLAYDGSIVVFALMALYLALYIFVFRVETARYRFAFAFGAGSVVLAALYFALRHMFVSGGWSRAALEMPSAVIMVKNIAMYLFALLFPIDPVLANEWFKTPLPSEIKFNNAVIAAIATAALFACAGLAVGVRSIIRRNPGLRERIDWPAVLVLVAGIGLPLAPVLVFTSHPSETYLYLSTAFYALLLAYAASKITAAMPAPTGHRVYAAAVVLLLVVFSAATWTRNSRVLQCATIARQILRALPADLLGTGSWTVSFAPAPEGREFPQYGLYALRGIHTIADSDQGLTAALQLVYGNATLAGKFVEEPRLAEGCAAPGRICFRVHSDGRVESVGAGSSRQPEKHTVGIQARTGPFGINDAGLQTPSGERR